MATHQVATVGRWREGTEWEGRGEDGGKKKRPTKKTTQEGEPGGMFTCTA